MITTYNGDFIDFDSMITESSIDLILTDPPYNISRGKSTPVWIDKVTGENKNTIHSHNFSETFDDEWDSVDHEEFIRKMSGWSDFWFRKLRKGGSFAIFISDRYISFLWKIMEEHGFAPKRIFTWKKPAAVPFNRNINPTSGCEYILWGIKPGGKRTFNSNTHSGSIIERFCLADKISSIIYRLIREGHDIDTCFDKARQEALTMISNRKMSFDMIECVVPNTLTFSGGQIKNRIHPTQKPTEVLKFFISLLTNENDTILDTFAGSGSSGLAACELNRNSILIERDSSMFEKMKNNVFTFDNFLNK